MRRTVTLEVLGWRIATRGVHVISQVTASKHTHLIEHTLLILSSQFTWHRNPNWSSFYSGSEEIWRYFKEVATTYDLEKYVKFNTAVEKAVWQEEEGIWKLTLVSSDGSRFEDECEILVNGTGVLKLVNLCSCVCYLKATESEQCLEIPRYTWYPGLQGKADA